MIKLRHACHYRPEEAKNLFTTEVTGIVLDTEFSISIETKVGNKDINTVMMIIIIIMIMIMLVIIIIIIIITTSWTCGNSTGNNLTYSNITLCNLTARYLGKNTFS